MQEIFTFVDALLKQLDIFGVPLQLSLQSNSKLYQSSFGGFLTFLIYFFSAFYSIQTICQRIYQQLPPSVTQQNIPTPYGDSIQLDQNLFEFSFYASGVQPEKFQRIVENNEYLFDYQVVLYPDQYNKTFSTKKDTCQQTLNRTYFLQEICQNVSNPKEINFYQDSSFDQDTQLYYTVVYCDPKKDIKCIDKDKIQEGGDSYWIYWQLIVYSQDVDLLTGDIFQIPTVYYLSYHNDTIKQQYIQLRLTKADVTIDDGFLFSNLRQFSIVKEIDVKISTENSYDGKSGPMIGIQMEKYKMELNISFPSITIILSQIISFFQTACLLGYFISKLNSTQMNKYLNQELLGVYFPQFRDVKVEKNCFGQFKSISYKCEKLDATTSQQVLQHQKQILEHVENRLNIIYLLNDIHQLQLALNIDQTQYEQKQYVLTILGDQSIPGRTESDFYRQFSKQMKKSDTTQIFPLQDPQSVEEVQQISSSTSQGQPNRSLTKANRDVTIYD